MPPEPEEPARDFAPSTRPGGRLPHGWLAPTTSTLDLIDLAVPTVLVRSGESTAFDAQRRPSQVVSVDAEVWDDTFGLAADLCLTVRPDQHIAARCPIVDVADCLEQLFPINGGVATTTDDASSTAR